MMQTQMSLAIILEPYKKLIEDQIQNNIEQLGPKCVLRDACEYALLNGENVSARRLF